MFFLYNDISVIALAVFKLLQKFSIVVDDRDRKCYIVSMTPEKKNNSTISVPEKASDLLKLIFQVWIILHPIWLTSDRNWTGYSVVGQAKALLVISLIWLKDSSLNSLHSLIQHWMIVSSWTMGRQFKLYSAQLLLPIKCSTFEISHTK